MGYSTVCKGVKQVTAAAAGCLRIVWNVPAATRMVFMATPPSHPGWGRAAVRTTSCTHAPHVMSELMHAHSSLEECHDVGHLGCGWVELADVMFVHGRSACNSWGAPTSLAMLHLKTMMKGTWNAPVIASRSRPPSACCVVFGRCWLWRLRPRIKIANGFLVALGNRKLQYGLLRGCSCN